jgi:hypothetical protein
MKAQRWINILITLVLIVLVYSEKPSRLVSLPMAIDFAKAENYIDFGSVSTVRNLANKSICAWINADTLGANAEVVTTIGAGGGMAEEYYSVWAKNDNKIYFEGWWTGGASLWSSAAVLSTGAWIHICVTYNNAIASDPIFYFNGAVSATTEVTAPSGTYVTGAGGTDRISGSSAGTSFDGKIADVRIYNRILTPAEVLDMYNRRSMNDNINGLVFNPVLYGAAACQAFDGTALATAHKIVDPYSGAIGTPSGSPVGAGETYLTVCP